MAGYTVTFTFTYLLIGQAIFLSFAAILLINFVLEQTALGGGRRKWKCCRPDADEVLSLVRHIRLDLQNFAACGW
jgi:hypothetical protein